jgi:hypothetical protein
MNSSEPFYLSVFGAQWENLPPALRKRYANKPYSNDVITVTGKLNINYSRLMTVILPLLKLCGALVPYKSNDVPVTVSFCSQPDSATLHFDRTFYFPGKEPYAFHSSIEQIKTNDVVEFMRFGFAWRALYSFDGSKIVMQHHGYVWKLFGKYISLPLSLLMGKCYAEEEALSENSFRMLMRLTHPLFGNMFEYAGEFTLVEKENA